MNTILSWLCQAKPGAPSTQKWIIVSDIAPSTNSETHKVCHISLPPSLQSRSNHSYSKSPNFAHCTALLEVSHSAEVTPPFTQNPSCAFSFHLTRVNIRTYIWNCIYAPLQIMKKIMYIFRVRDLIKWAFTTVH